MSEVTTVFEVFNIVTSVIMYQLQIIIWNLKNTTFLYIQWNLDLSFFKGMEKTIDECGKTINPGNYYTL